jgi:hypothetical protein
MTTAGELLGESPRQPFGRPLTLFRRVLPSPGPGRIATRPDGLPDQPRDQDRAAAGRPVRALTVAAALGWAVAGVALFACYLHMSRSVPVNSDGASNALQAWAMLHGNPLLRGWELSDVSFYTTELPEYMLIELVRGLRPDVVHVAAAMTYTLVVLLAARLAKGRATGSRGVLRAGLAAGIMLAPQASEVQVLMLSPDHVGSTIPVLLIWLLIDGAGRRWWVPVATALLLAWALVADQILLLTGVAPIVLVALVRAYERAVRQRAPARSAAFELGLAAAGLAGAAAGEQILVLIRASGGFFVWPVSDRLVPLAGLGHNLLQTYQGILLLFGAGFMGQQAGVAAAAAMAHLVGVGLAGWAACAAVRRFARCELVVQLMVVAVLVSLAAYALGPNAGQPLSSREFAAVLPFGAALAGRTLAGRLSRARLVPALGLALAVYAAAAVSVAALPAVPAQNQALASWLAAHRLTYGLSGYWIANSVTLDSGGAVQLCPLKGNDHTVRPEWWEIQQSWYDPALHVANFVVLPSNGIGPPPGPGPLAPTVAGALGAFGQPARVYYLAQYTVLVWNKNLLTVMR